jgi:4-hydroxybenzoate polyprenyltransferase
MLRKVHAYLVLPHAVPVIAVLATTAGFAVLAADGVPGSGDLARLLLAMLGSQVAIGAVNEVVDAELDAVAKPQKPIPAGLVSRRAALIVAACSLVAMVWFSAGFGWESLLLCGVGTAAGLAYDLWFKRTLLSWLPYLLALPLIPIWVWTAIDQFESGLLALYPLGALAIVGVHLGQALPDVASDRASGVINLVSALGERRAIVACWGLTLLTAILAAGAAPAVAERVWPVLVASGLAVALVGADVALYLNRGRLGVMACFPIVAASVALMGLGWVMAVR